MIKAFYTARTGAAEHQKKMAVAANNMANANTDGFKASNATFQELLNQRVRLPDDYEQRRGLYDMYRAKNFRNWDRGAPAVFDEDGEPVHTARPGDYFTENKLRVGTGSRLSENAMVMTQGNLVLTNDPFTAALADPRAFFAVIDASDPDSGIAYTRNGVFSLSNEDDGIFLVTSAGEYVLDENYNVIEIPENTTGENIMLMPYDHPIMPYEYPETEFGVIVRLGIYTFDNVYGLAHIGSNKYASTELSGMAQLYYEPSDDVIRQYYVEASNVKISDEMVKVIESQRAFQSNLTTIRTADEIQAYINQLSGQ